MTIFQLSFGKGVWIWKRGRRFADGREEQTLLEYRVQYSKARRGDTVSTRLRYYSLSL